MLLAAYLRHWARENIMKYKKEILIFFSILDAFLLGKCVQDINFSANPFLLNQLKSFLLISLAASAFGLACQRKWGYLLYYVQFPFRYLFVLLSFGFLTYFVPASPPSFTKLMIIFAMILEIARLTLTIKIQVKNNQATSGNPVPQDA